MIRKKIIGLGLMIASVLLFLYFWFGVDVVSNQEGYFNVLCLNEGYEYHNHSLEYYLEIENSSDVYKVCCQNETNIVCWNDVLQNTISLGGRKPDTFLNKK